MKAKEVRQIKKPKPIGECSGSTTATAVPLSLSTAPAAPAQCPQRVGVFICIEDAPEKVFFPNITRVAEIWQVLTQSGTQDEVTDSAQSAYVGAIFIASKRRSSVVVTQSTPLTLQVTRSPFGVSLRLHKKFVKAFTTFRVPKRFKRIFKLLSKQLKPLRLKLFKPKPLRKVVTPLQKRNRSPTKHKHRKAKEEDAEGDAKSHSDFWFATVKPRAIRAPTPALPPAER